VPACALKDNNEVESRAIMPTRNRILTALVFRKNLFWDSKHVIADQLKPLGLIDI
jgi:hypothetical protein